jgi:hypothetical protein
MGVVGAIGASSASTGMYGFSGEGSTSRGVRGVSPAGHGIHGESTSGFAGYFAGKVYSTKFYEMKEISAPPAPAANKARLVVRDNGGFTQLCVRFNTGGVKVLATQT